MNKINTLRGIGDTHHAYNHYSVFKPHKINRLCFTDALSRSFSASYNVYCGYSKTNHKPLWLQGSESNKSLTALYRKESKSDKLIGGACLVAFFAMVILVGVSL